MRAITKHQLDEIERSYDPENDIPQGPRVTWAEWYLKQAVEELFAYVRELETKIGQLQALHLQEGHDDN